jgi:hypothetical protein
MYHYNLLIKKLGFHSITEKKGLIIPTFENFHLGLWLDSMVPKYYRKKFEDIRRNCRPLDDIYFTLPMQNIDDKSCIEFVPSEERWKTIGRILKFKYLLKTGVNYNSGIEDAMIKYQRLIENILLILMYTQNLI